MTRVRIVLPYFGPLPNTWDLTVWTMGRNTTVDWLVLTDQPQADHVSTPNVEIRLTSFEQMRGRITSKFSTAVTDFAPYKLCDYKPAFGVLFEDDLVGYDYWGYCDADVLFGDLRSELEHAFSLGVDRIFERGHLSLLRNSPEIVGLFQHGRGRYSFDEVIATATSRAFDEIGGFYQIAVDHDLSTFEPFSLYDIFPDRYWPVADTHLREARRLIYMLNEHGTFAFDQMSGTVASVGRYIHLQKRSLSLPPLSLPQCLEEGAIAAVAPTELVLTNDIRRAAELAEQSGSFIAHRLSWTARYARRRGANLHRKLWK